MRELNVTIETRQGRDRRRRAILILLVAGLSLNGNRERNPVAAAFHPSPATVQSTAEKNEAPADDDSVTCKDESARVQNGLREIFRDFQRSDSTETIEVLVDLDSRIRVLLNSRPSDRRCEDDSRIYDPQWEAMGVYLGYWVDLVYSGRLLYAAHKRKPNSPLRRYTLFAAIFKTKPYHGLGVMPDIKAAFIYSSEFPDGPFAKETFRVIADFHKDLFMVLRDRQRDYKYDCYKPYITSSPIRSQKQQARRTALTYYRKALEIDSSNEGLTALSNDLEKGTVKAWSFCAD